MRSFAICGFFITVVIVFPSIIADIEPTDGYTTNNQMAASFISRASDLMYMPLTKVYGAYRQQGPLSKDVSSQIHNSMECFKKLDTVANHLLQNQINIRKTKKTPNIEVELSSPNEHLIQDMINFVMDLIEVGQTQEFHADVNGAVICLETLLADVRNLTKASVKFLN